MKKISMEIVNPHAAGIDVGSKSHMLQSDRMRNQMSGKFNVYTCVMKK